MASAKLKCMKTKCYSTKINIFDMDNVRNLRHMKKKIAYIKPGVVITEEDK